MTVWVLMGNDYPAGVFSTEEKAQAEIERRKAFDRAKIDRGEQSKFWPGIHWYSKPFDLDAA